MARHGSSSAAMIRALRWSAVGAAVAIVGGVAAPAFADTATIVSAIDNTLYETPDGFLSNGAGPNFFVGRTNGGSLRRGLVKFQVDNFIPAGATITSVSLRLNASRGSGTETITLNRVTQSWGESDSVATGNGGSGQQASPGDATWLHRFAPDPNIPGSGSFWTTPGGDFVATASASRSVSSTGAITWTSTPQMVADVQAWLDTPSGNYGWILRGNEATNHSAKRFDTHEHPTVANRPVLTITFTPPAPACPADFDHNGAVEPADIAAFVNAWFASIQNGTLAGDFDHNGVVEPADIAGFVNAWFSELGTGC